MSSLVCCCVSDIVTDDKYTVLRLSNITAGPDPLIAPGDMYFNFNMDIRKRLPRNIDASLVAGFYLLYNALLIKNIMSDKSVMQLYSCEIWLQMQGLH